MNPRLRCAEAVLPGHPDKLCDAIADSLVDAAVARDPDSHVAVEVAVHRSRVFVDGRIAAAPPFNDDEIGTIVRRVYADTGHGAVWQPAPENVTILTDICHEPLVPAEKQSRGFSDDQAVCVGYACRDERTNFLPLEQFLAGRLARGLHALRFARPELNLGPDGKILVAAEEGAQTFHLRSVNLTVQHQEQIDWVALSRELRALVFGTLSQINRDCLVLRCSDDVRIEINGDGGFTLGGPEGDNGLSGKKLVVDGWGPSAPIGGGAMSGKDPHKIDRAGTLRARQIAREIVATGLAGEAEVMLAFFPGDWEPCHFGIRVDGRPLAPRSVAQWRAKHDLSILGTNRELGLDRILWEPLAVWGHFTDAALPWEDGTVSTPLSAPVLNPNANSVTETRNEKINVTVD